MMMRSEKPFVPSGILRGDEADRLQVEKIREIQLERAGIFLVVEVEVEIAAALDDAGVDRRGPPRSAAGSRARCRTAQARRRPGVS